MHALELACPVLFLSTLSLRRATVVIPGPAVMIPISIHALLAESDHRRGICPTGYFIISIHALLAESDVSIHFVYLRKIYFYPRSPCGERHSSRIIMLVLGLISIHALLAESDRTIFAVRPYDAPIFLSTLSLRRATETQKPKPTRQNQISIHALLAESDIKNSPALLGNPQFLSTLSLRRATSQRR